jgi:aminoglycoside 6'-N-acetyltransferase
MNEGDDRPRGAVRAAAAVDRAAANVLGTVRLRAAASADAPLLRHWDEQPHVVASDPNDDWRWETELVRTHDWREQLVAEVDGRPIGFVQIIDPAREESHYWGDVSPDLRAVDVWIGPAEDLGRGYGTQIMRLALDRCFADRSVAAVLINPLASNLRAQRFYERLGFRCVGPRRFGDDECLVYRLDRSRFRVTDQGAAAGKTLSPGSDAPHAPRGD